MRADQSSLDTRLRPCSLGGHRIEHSRRARLERYASPPSAAHRQVAFERRDRPGFPSHIQVLDAARTPMIAKAGATFRNNALRIPWMREKSTARKYSHGTTLV